MMKSINIEGKDYFLIPKPTEELKNTKDEKPIIIEPVKVRTKKIFYVKTRYMWGEDYDIRIHSDFDDNDGIHWMTYQREEWEDGDYCWIRTFGGFVEANDDEERILELWYQSTLNLESK